MPTMDGEGVTDWDNIKWGSFTEQFQRFKELYHNTDITDLEQFAKFILRDPKKYQKKTVRRARFYVNVLKKKSHKTDIDESHPKSAETMEVHHYHHHIHHNAGDGFFDKVRDAFDPKKNGAAKAFDPNQNGVAKAFDPKQNGVSDAFKPGGSAQQFGEKIGQTLRDNIRPIIHTGLNQGISVLTGVPGSGAVLGQAGLNNLVDKGLDKANLGFGLLPKKHRRFVKGSQEAKDYMATLRRMRSGKKEKSKGKGIPAPHSRSPITDPTLLG
jgi:hypothetical protein